MKPIWTAILALTVSVCSGLEEVVPIVKYESKVGRPDGSYKWSYEAANGIIAQEEAHLGISNVLEVKGSYSYVSPEGEPVSIIYFADTHGFRAEGRSIPQPPAIPEAIQRALEWNAVHPEEVEKETKRPLFVPISFPGRFGEKDKSISTAAITSLQKG